MVIDFFIFLCFSFQVQLRGAILKQLRELKQLHDCGVITEAQFMKQKGKLLEEIKNILGRHNILPAFFIYLTQSAE